MGRRQRTRDGRITVEDGGTWLTPCREVPQTVQGPEAAGGTETEYVLAAVYQRTPEDLAMNHEAINKISNEAKDVLRLLATVPAEIGDTLYDEVRGHISQVRLVSFIVAWWAWPEVKIKRVLAELKRLTEAMV